MYYRKFFSGTHSDLSSVGTVALGKTKSSAGSSNGIGKDPTAALARDIVTVLKIAGLGSAYTSPSPQTAYEAGMIYPFGKGTCGVQVFAGFNNTNMYVNLPHIPGGVYTYSAYTTCSGPVYDAATKAYRYYITFKGDPMTGFFVYIGNYINPQIEQFLFGVLRAKKDPVSGRGITVFMLQETNAPYYVCYSDSQEVAYVTATAINAQAYTAVPIMSVPADTMVLKNFYLPSFNGVELEGCYMGMGSLPNDKSFYLADGREFYLTNSKYLLVECPTRLNL